ncbi:MAG: tyrosine-type recombinase/integrase [Bacteroidota bacterium]
MLLQSFLHHLTYEKKYSVHTIESYRRDLEQLEDFFEGNAIPFESPSDLPNIHHRDLRSWASFLMEDEKNSPRTVARKLSAARSFFSFWQKRQAIESNPADRVSLPKFEKKLPAFLKQEATRELLDNWEFPDDFDGKRDRMILEILYSCGLRRAELLGLKLEDVDLYAKQLKVRGKGNKERIIPFGQPTKEAIEAYLSVLNQLPHRDKSVLILRKNGRPAYPKLVYNVVYTYLGKVSSLQQRGPHTLRHTYATHMLDNGADLNAIKELLGHSSLASTQVYTHNSISKLKNIHKLAHPRADLTNNS